MPYQIWATTYRVSKEVNEYVTVEEFLAQARLIGIKEFLKSEAELVFIYEFDKEDSVTGALIGYKSREFFDVLQIDEIEEVYRSIEQIVNNERWKSKGFTKLAGMAAVNG